MKRFLSFALVGSLAFSGCGKAPGVAVENKPRPAEEKPTVVAAKETPAAPTAFVPSTQRLIAPEEVPLLEQIDRENIKVVAAASPSIVRVTAVHKPEPKMQLAGKGKMPFQFHFGPGAPHSLKQEDPSSFGSGVIISRDGYIVTNNHVVEDSSEIQVELQDKSMRPARLIAGDPAFDVAVLKIDATNLPALPWGDSNKVQVGEQVFAIGNPFNLGDSVSKGIVSAKGRNLGNARSYEDYIQMDAAINPGNSGGALINIHGELIGLNAAIASVSRYSMGVGFAIPSNLVRYAVDGLIRDGKLVRGYLGVSLPGTIDEGVIDQLGLKNDQGALLSGVQQGSPADRAKLRAGDFVTEIDGHRIASFGDLRLVVAQIPVGKEVEIKYVRDGASQSARVKIAAVPQDIEREQANGQARENTDQVPSSPVPHAPEADTVLSGLKVVDLDDATRQKLGLDNFTSRGVLVSEVAPGSVAEQKGLEKGDVIESIGVNRGSTREVATAKDFTEVAKGLKADQSVILLIHHGKASSFVYLTPSK